MAVKAVKYLLAFLVLCISFQVYSIWLDHLFFHIEGISNEAAIDRAYKIYFSYFLGYFGFFALLACIFFELAISIIPGMQSFKVQFWVALVFGSLIGLAIGEGNISLYYGRFEVLKNAIVYALLGMTFIALKTLFKIKTGLWEPPQAQ